VLLKDCSHVSPRMLLLLVVVYVYVLPLAIQPLSSTGVTPSVVVLEDSQHAMNNCGLCCCAQDSAGLMTAELSLDIAWNQREVWGVVTWYHITRPHHNASSTGMAEATRPSKPG
jgi:hypothetical protein